ncbi:MAG: adenylate kinase family protein [Candidatus Methanospirareceae archaeon]
MPFFTRYNVLGIYKVYDLNALIKSKRFIYKFDTRRDCYEVALDKLETYLETEIQTQLNKVAVYLIGHLSHLLKLPELVIVLRCHPETLRQRLEIRNYPKAKIIENLEAEAVDTILIESLELHSNVYELDTTNLSLEAVAGAIIDITNRYIENKDLSAYAVGKYMDPIACKLSKLHPNLLTFLAFGFAICGGVSIAFASTLPLPSILVPGHYL